MGARRMDACSFGQSNHGEEVLLLRTLGNSHLRVKAGDVAPEGAWEGGGRGGKWGQREES